MEDLVTSAEAAALLGMTQAGINTRRRAGQLVAARKAGQMYFFKRSDVLAQPRGMGKRGPKPGSPAPW